MTADGIDNGEQVVRLVFNQAKEVGRGGLGPVQ